MKTWINPETFDVLGVVRNQCFDFPKSPDQNSVNERLATSLHPDLYQYFQSGGEILFRPNHAGEIELFALLNDVDPDNLANSTFGIDNMRVDRNQFTFEFLIFDRQDDPLRLSFVFQLVDDVQRYCAATVCEQREIPFYFLQNDGDFLIATCCKIFNWPDQIRESFRVTLREAYQVDDGNHVGDSIRAIEISEDELTANGWAYQFDLNILKGLQNKNHDVSDFIRSVVYECFQLIAKSKYKEVKKGPFLAWMDQRKGVYGASGEDQAAVTIVISPLYNERSPRATTEIEPCFDFVQSIKGFIRVKNANPIFENALPIFRYNNGHIKRIELDHSFLEVASAMQADMLAFNGISRENHFDIYRALLEGK